jgi:terminal uridylyltransferase
LQERVADVGIDMQEEAEKEAFRSVVEQLCREAISEYEQQDLGNQQFDPCTVELQCFGSMKSGFATKASDMDLALLTPKSSPAPDSPDSSIPRILEKKLLSAGYGARLLTRTRVPIIKLCEKPTEKLLSDLLEERSKWENGFTAEPEDDDEELEETATDATTSAEKVAVIEAAKAETQPEAGKVPKRRPVSQSTSATEDTSQKTKEGAHERRVGLLKQKDQQSLGDYYNTAKRYLRKIGGRDITASSPDLDEVESEILNDVCKNFIFGLSSEALSARLRSYQSIAPLFDPSLPRVQRSLQGVWTQIEGERLALAWETRPLSEPDDRYEFECLNNVQAWRALQDKQGPLIESLVYNRQLYVAAEKLKKISSLQLVHLEQIQQEEPIYYQARAKKIMDDLTGRDLRSSSSTIAPIIVAHYIAGIYDKEIREALENADRSGANLPTIALHHRALQLAKDYEHALNVGLYEDADRPDVERYISLLRSRNYYDVPVPPEPTEANLITKIRGFPDPTKISLNKPRDRYKDHLEFPKTDIGIQCDINFSAHLAIHNTQLLRCYSQSDPRVKPMILFVKNWAKVRGINTPYRGTLSSYGYVLMVLHYLVNIAQPFVCPNLQLVNKDPPHYLPPAEIEARTTCKGKDVRFWRNEAEIGNLAERNMLCHNHDSVGILLRGFFEYFAQNGQMTTVQNRGFDWGREVLSLRTPGGILTKQEKNWVGAKTIVETTTVAAPPTPSTVKSPSPDAETEGCSTTDTPEIKTPKLPQKTVEETKEIRHRYLFAIEDPFELDHNVARTVTHNGIVSIRDEFRRAWRVIRSVGKPYEGQEGGLLDPVKTVNEKSGFQELMDLIHGPVAKIDVVAQEVKGMDLEA